MTETSERLTRLETLGEQVIKSTEKVIDIHDRQIEELQKEVGQNDKRIAVMGVKITGIVTVIMFVGSWIKNHLSF